MRHLTPNTTKSGFFATLYDIHVKKKIKVNMVRFLAISRIPKLASHVYRYRMFDVSLVDGVGIGTS